jgi:plasmid stability protein
VEKDRAPSILVRGLDPKTVQRLKARARINGRSLQQEIQEILERAAEMLTTRKARRYRSGGGTGSAGSRSPTVRD